MTMRIGFTCAAALVAAAALGGSAVPASAATTLTAASCFPIGSPPSRSFEALVKEINAQGGDTVKIDLKGGAPAIGSPFTLTQKMARGAYDLVGCTEAYFGNVLPEAPVFRLSNMTYAELRNNGALDYAQQLLTKKNIQFIARHDDNGPFHLWLSKPIDKPDLTGLHLRVSPVYTPFFTALGATTQLSNIAQVYTYMENNTVQGFGWPAVGWVPAWIKVTKYRVDPGFYLATLHTLANLKAWKKAPQAARDIIEKIGLAFEVDAETSGPKFKARLKKQLDWMASEGLKTITFTGAEGEKWIKTANDAAWAQVIERSPEHGPKLRALFTK